MLTREEIEKIAMQKYPDKRELHYPTNMDDDEWIDQLIDRNAEKRTAFIEGIIYGLSVGKREY